MVEPIIGQPAIRHVEKWGSPDWEPDATQAHQVYARSAAMSIVAIGERFDPAAGINHRQR